MSDRKTKTLTLIWHLNGTSVDGKPWLYRVVQITDSIDFHPGQMLHQNEVQALCTFRDWKVTIKGAAA